MPRNWATASFCTLAWPFVQESRGGWPDRPRGMDRSPWQLRGFASGPREMRKVIGRNRKESPPPSSRELGGGPGQLSFLGLELTEHREHVRVIVRPQVAL